MSEENILLKDILNNNTLYEVEEDKNNELQYKLKDGEKIRICEISELDFNSIKLYPDTKDKSIEFIASKRMGSSEVKENFLASDLVNWYSIDDLTNIKDLYINEPNTKIKISQNDVNKHFSVLSDKRLAIKKGNILVSFKMTIGITKIYNSDKPSYCNEAIDIINIVDKKKYDNKYLSILIGKEYLKYTQINVGSITLNDKLKNEIYIKVPTYKNNNTLLIQKSIAKNIEDKLSIIEEKINILSSMDKLIDIKIEKYLDDKIKYIQLSNNKMELNLVKNNKIFNFVKGKRVTSSKISNIKTEINKIPVFSASKFDNEVLGFSNKEFLQNNGNTIIYNKCVLINTDGTGAGKTRIKNEIFAINDVVFAIELLDAQISLNYIKRVIDSELNKHNLGYANKLYEQDLQKKDIKIIIPLKNDGKIDYTLINEIDNHVELIKKKSINTSNMKKVLEFAKGKIWIF